MYIFYALVFTVIQNFNLANSVSTEVICVFLNNEILCISGCSSVHR